ncbi:hypothetical protein EVAR_29658_1 [Eumeta japonica]|uniref:Uncharacterized protein n=1 Tax=Eumeta variegata TaxID=151549 RepID=A0A4C1WA90_EUMVA|nr:hypothetical protein EVAR_29658_1 [Eumeta japonica]
MKVTLLRMRFKESTNSDSNKSKSHEIGAEKKIILLKFCGKDEIQLFGEIRQRANVSPAVVKARDESASLKWDDSAYNEDGGGGACAGPVSRL